MDGGDPSTIHRLATRSNAIDHDVTLSLYNELGYSTRLRAADTLVPAMDFSRKANYIGLIKVEIMTNITTSARYNRYVYARLGTSGRMPVNTIPY